MSVRSHKSRFGSGCYGASSSLLLLAVAFFSSLVPAHAAPWLPFGPDGGDARRFAADPRDAAHLFVGTATGWIFESHNGGTNWRRLAQVGKRDDLVIDNLIVDPANSRHLIVGAWAIDHPDGGLFTSTDGGLTWLNQAEMRGQSIRSLAESHSDPKIFVAGSLQGVFRSNDGGQRWHRISPVDSTEIHEVESVAIDPVDPNIIYAGTWHLPWKTTDGGEHWDNIKDGIYDDSDVFSIIVDPKAPKTVYASACSGIYKSINAGEHFERVQGIPSAARRTRVLLQDPEHLETVFAGTTEGLFRSEDAGKLWSRTTAQDLVVNDVFVDPGNSKRVLIAIDHGGVLASDDGGDTFHPSNGGYSARQITSLKRDTRHPATLFVGVVNDKEWGGVFESDNGALTWSQRSEGLQGRDVFALGQAPDGTMIAGTSHGLYRYDPQGVTWNVVEDVSAPGDVPAAPAEPARPASSQVRAPVPVNRNQFAEHLPAGAHLTATQQKALASQARQKQLAKMTPSQRKAAAGSDRKKQALFAKNQAKTSTKASMRTTLAAKHPTPALARPAPAVTPPGTRAGATKRFDGSVYSIVTAGDTLLAATSSGLLASSDNGLTWGVQGPASARDWRYMAAAKRNVVAASMQAVVFSSDAGTTWVPLVLPENLTRVAAVAVEPSGILWVGGREGVFVSNDGGTSWTTPKNLYVNSVSSLFYDDALNTVTLTTAASGYNGLVFTVQLPQRSVSYVDAGWTLRFARPVGDHLLAATLFDGIVIQPKVVPAPDPAVASTSSAGVPPVSQKD